MATKILTCNIDGCPTPNIPYDEEVPSTPTVSQLKSVLEDFFAEKIKDKTISSQDAITSLTKSEESEARAAFHLEELIKEATKKMDLKITKTNVEGDIKVVFCDTGHPNYVID